MFGSSDAMTCITLDALISAAAFLVWAYTDMHTLQLSLASYVAVCAGIAVAIAVPIPLYLAARTVRLAHIRAASVAESLQQPECSAFCPLAVFVLLAAVSQAVFISNVDSLRS